MKSTKELQFKSLYKNHKDKVYRLCLGFVKKKELANDLFQEILIKVWRHLDSFKGESDISTWIYRIAYNTALTFSARERKKDEKQTEIPSNQELSEPENYNSEQEIRIQMLYEAINGLPELDRVIATLLLENTSYKTIAEISGISENYVAVKVNRIKAALTQKLNPQAHGNQLQRYTTTLAKSKS
ncbi:RNA polymerase sigma factor [Algoriphagus boritolerans]|uniref:RNA polymerase sigma-70 factor, ECF subfamily n=1 Tax=Algoriphagus boritolerans DSM 17298 = JCM 18970 TaxID=1120964 RepID=A0A1H5XZM4_9BACT|nr:sigma-70 family RNA polymerase sigma factor [Algoriphagus boritolerans]SEG17161.1 RNA polymerase sigma-70 factor, ECF subfamily [Algoriphagus boritolerans DSM 17298 = JCM 18970]